MGENMNMYCMYSYTHTAQYSSNKNKTEHLILRVTERVEYVWKIELIKNWINIVFGT